MSGKIETKNCLKEGGQGASKLLDAYSANSDKVLSVLYAKRRHLAMFDERRKLPRIFKKGLGGSGRQAYSSFFSNSGR